jgi:Right handed beta helix region
MTARGLKSTLILGLAFLFTSVLQAEAQTAYRTYVSGGSGNDSNPCTRALPCQTLRAAMFQTNTAGVVEVVDASEDFGIFAGPVTISKSISIISSGGRAGISGALLVSPEAGGQVLLRGLDFSVGGGGVQVSTGVGVSLVIDDCTFTNTNILFQPSGTVTSNLVVRNSVVSGNLSGTGIVIQPQSTGKATAVIENVIVNNNSFGIRAYDYANVTVRNSVITENTASGIRCDSSVGGLVSVFVEHSQSSHNAGNGVIAVGSMAVARLTEVTITDNGNGVYYVSGGTVCSFGNNSIAGNTFTLAPTACPLS